MIYLDNNTTTPLHEDARTAMQAALEPGFVWDVQAFEEQFRSAFGLVGGQILLTSGGTENSAMAFATAHSLNPRSRMICNLADHISVLNQRGMVSEKGDLPIEMIPIMSDGQPDPAIFHQAMGPGLGMVTFTLVNSETGVILVELHNMLSAINPAQSNILIYLDACQAVGRLNLTGISNRISMLGISSHKFHGPKGIGALWVRNRLSVEPAHGGGLQQQGGRPGSYSDVLGAGMAAAFNAVQFRDLDKNTSHMSYLQKLMEHEMLRIPNCTINFGDCARVCNTTNYLIKDVDTKILRLLLREYDIIVSDTTGGLQQTTGISPLMSFLHSEEDCYSNLRLSLSYETTEEDILKATSIIGRAVKVLRKNPVKLHTCVNKEGPCTFSGKATHCLIGETREPV